MKDLSINEWSKIMTIKSIESMANQILQDHGYTIEGESMEEIINDDPYGLIEGQWTEEEKMWWGYNDPETHHVDWICEDDMEWEFA
jgi:hypothetical protein